jgi:hypothetical protein
LTAGATGELADLDLYVAILIRAGEIARQKYGVPTLILYLPDNLSSVRYRLGPSYSNEDIIRRLRDGGLRVVDVQIDVSAYSGQTFVIPGDGHPTGLADRIWAGRVRTSSRPRSRPAASVHDEALWNSMWIKHVPCGE